MSILGSSSYENLTNSPLVGDSVRLRLPVPGDWQEWSQLRESSREFLVPWEPEWANDSHSRVAYRRRLRRQKKEASEGISFSFFVVRLSDRRLLGGITLNNIQRGVSQSCSVGYWIGKRYARSGYMTEGLHCVLSHCFKTVGLNRGEAACMPDNGASKALLIRCGFQREGYAKKYLKINGVWRDHLLFAILKDELVKQNSDIN